MVKWVILSPHHFSLFLENTNSLSFSTALFAKEWWGVCIFHNKRVILIVLGYHHPCDRRQQCNNTFIFLDHSFKMITQIMTVRTTNKKWWVKQVLGWPAALKSVNEGGQIILWSNRLFGHLIWLPKMIWYYPLNHLTLCFYAILVILESRDGALVGTYSLLMEIFLYLSLIWL